MKTVIIVSRCLRTVRPKDAMIEAHFHFKGICAGDNVRDVILQKPQSVRIRKGREYLLYVQFHSCAEGVLRGKILRAKPLDECWDNASAPTKE
jgi:hypothetical protein